MSTCYRNDTLATEQKSLGKKALGGCSLSEKPELTVLIRTSGTSQVRGSFISLHPWKATKSKLEFTIAPADMSVHRHVNGGKVIPLIAFSHYIKAVSEELELLRSFNSGLTRWHCPGPHTSVGLPLQEVAFVAPG